MGSTTVIITPFDSPVFNVTEFENTRVMVKPFEDTVIVVPGTGEEELQGLDYTLDFTLE